MERAFEPLSLSQGRIMYLDHFNLNELPFKNTPDTGKFFHGGARSATLEALQYAITHKLGITKIIGEVGTGKTMLCHMLASTLPSHVDMVYIANPKLLPNHLFHYIAHELDLPVTQDTSKFEVMQMITYFLLKQHENERITVILIEEAQSMRIDTLEEIRLLSNLETTHDKLLQIVLFGQPEFDETLLKTEIRQLRERISFQITLSPLNDNEVYEYLNFRLRSSGYTGSELFDYATAKKIRKHTQGLVRRINHLADKILLSAFCNNRHEINRTDIRFGLHDCDFKKIKHKRKSRLQYA